MDREKVLGGFSAEELLTLKKLAETQTIKPFGDPLPKDFDGIFRFTNSTDEEFVTRWNNVEYRFPPMSTTPILINTATPLEIQNIRKKFARELAVKQYYGTDKFKKMDSIKDKKPPTYTDDDLTPFIQKCLEPLAPGRAVVRELERDNEKKYRKNSKGEPITKVIDKDTSLVGDGAVMEG